jgi:hypothetical protein
MEELVQRQDILEVRGMNPVYITSYWPYWLAGLILFPLLAVLPQLANIRKAIDIGDRDGKEVAKMFLAPSSLIITVVFGLGAFICFILFLASVLAGLIAAIKGIVA